jgi:tetraacyldisaccharide 4'-kinase
VSGPLPGFLAPLTVPASWAYGAVIARRNARFDRGVGVERVDRPVISVGNLTTGGTGKTPMVAWIAESLQEAGHRPVIAMRGYAARPGAPSDEEAEYADRLDGVPVVADPRRADALRRWLPDHRDIDCVILDDGFQHRQLHRDLDVVLVDAERPALGDRLLPAGHLREPAGSLQRAGAVVITRAASIDPALARAVERHHGRPPLAWSRHAWPSVRVLEPGVGDGFEPASWLSGKRVVTMLGVGHPASIRRQLERAGANVVTVVPATDHEDYTRAKIAMARGFCDGADALVTTGKDWVKIRGLLDWRTWPSPIVVPQLRLEILDGAEDLRDRLRQAVRLET